MLCHAKNLKQQIKGEINQIIENWCLIRHNVLIGQDIYTNHWMAEMTTNFHNIMKLSISGNNTSKSRLKVFEEILTSNNLRDNTEIIKILKPKLKKEKIQIDDTIRIVSSEFVLEWDNILYILSECDENELKKFEIKTLK